MIRVGLIQPSIRPYTVLNNLKLLSDKLQQLKNKGVYLAILPEFFATGNTLEPELLKVSIQNADTIRKWLKNQSRSLNMIIAGAYLDQEGKDVYNKFIIQEPTGAFSYHLKTHQPVVESLYYKVAQHNEHDEHIVDSSLGKIGLITCVEMYYPQITYYNYSKCSLILIAFAIPNRCPALLKGLTEIPDLLARRNGIPVLLCNMGGNFYSNGSPIFPIKIRGKYAGKSGIYLPSGPLAGPLPTGEDNFLVADIPIGPRVKPPDFSIKIKPKWPTYMRVFDTLMKRKAHKLYTKNLKQWQKNNQQNDT